MKPAPFDYIRAETCEEALAALSEHGDAARILAGGQSLLPMLNMRLATPSILVDTSRLGRSAQIRAQGDSVEIEAGVSQARLLGWSGLAEALPLFAKALPWVGHAQTRARGTVCGSVAHADPSAEIPLCLAVLGGEIVLSTRRKSRRVGSGDFHIGMMMTGRRNDEMLTALRLPQARPGEGYGFAEYGRRHGDFAVVACAAKVTADSITLGVGGVGDTPVVMHWDALAGSALDDALNACAWSLGARDDVQADARMRRDLVRGLGRRAIDTARQGIAE
ncbi:xanthine dehydrogenase family protein subunit M [Sedimentitalea sp. XS_ASV28]|uniref:FAD binding domain-containing protein n=1 Tax=Sedimentitalea sp. XS_ASV28 TaxID=3241296 RepID=UPI00351208D6